jgi:hypothetical protein
VDDADASRLVEKVLAPNEHIVWSQAAPWASVLISNGLMLLFVAAFTGAWWFFRKQLWESFRTGEWWRRLGIGTFFAMLAFVNITILAQVSGSFATAYAVTNQRVLIVEQGPWRIVSSYDENRGVSRVEVHGDRIDIVRDSRKRGFWAPMFGVRKARHVADLVRERVKPRPIGSRQ